MVRIIKIVKDSKMLFYPQKFYLNEGKKNSPIVPKGWWKNDKTFEDCVNVTKGGNYNAIMIRMNTSKYLVMDTDSKESYDKLCSFLKKQNLYNEKSITQSISNRLKNENFKCHFWFQIAEDDLTEFMKIEGGAHLNKSIEFDWFYNGECFLFEYCDSYLDDIQTLDFEDLKYIMKKMDVKIPYKEDKKKEKKEEKKEENDFNNLFEDLIDEKYTNKEEKIKNIKEDVTMDEKIILMINGLNKKRWETYEDWIKLGMIFSNEKWDMKKFNDMSKNYKGYDEQNNEKIVKGLKQTTNGYTIATIYKWLKEDNIELFNEVQNNRQDFWNLMRNLNQNEMAKFYFNQYPDKFIRSSVEGWYEYKQNKILYYTGKEPENLLNSISDTIQNIIGDQIKNIKLNKDECKEKMKLVNQCFKNLGNSKFVSGIIDYLKCLYTVEDLHKKIDANKNIIAFNNCVYDLEIKKFREIKNNDYISRTVGYNINLKSNINIKNEIENILSEIFTTKDMIDYYKKIISMSFFGNKEQYLFIHEGEGSNGKSLLSDFLRKALGDYFYDTDNDFLTELKKNGGPNSTLANSKGKIVIVVQEPAGDLLNTELIKNITGKETITTRDLYKGNVTFDNLFTPHLQCNIKPKLNKLDGGIKRRIRIIPYLNKFVENPTKQNEKLKDYNLGNKLSQKEYINEFMLILLESVNIWDDIKMPKLIEDATVNYIDDNNIIKNFIDSKINFTGNDKDKIKCSDLYEKYLLFEEDTKLTKQKFNSLLPMNNITKQHKSDGYPHYFGISYKI